MAGIAKEPMPHSGEACAWCDKGRLLVYSTRIINGVRVRYLRCSACRKPPAASKQVVPIEFGPARAR